MLQKNNTKRTLYYDVLNIVAIFCVICIHCNGISFNYQPTLAWLQSFLFCTFAGWCVPVFFMLSGATLINYRERYSTKTFFIKRVKKTVIPFIVWSILAAIFIKANPFELGFREFISQFLNTKFMLPYWFFIALFTLYLALPVLSLIKEHRNVLWYLVIGGYFINSFMPQVCTALQIRWNTGISMQYAVEGIFYAILGYLFSTQNFTKKQRLIIYSLSVFAILLRIIGTILLSYKKGSLDNFFWGYYDLPAILLSCGVFIFARYNKILSNFSNNLKISNFLKKVSGCSFGIYLMHMFIYGILLNFFSEATWVWRIIFPFVIYFIGLLVTLIIKKIPILKNIVP